MQAAAAVEQPKGKKRVLPDWAAVKVAKAEDDSRFGCSKQRRMVANAERAVELLEQQPAEETEQQTRERCVEDWGKFYDYVGQEEELLLGAENEEEEEEEDGGFNLSDSEVTEHMTSEDALEILRETQPPQCYEERLHLYKSSRAVLLEELHKALLASVTYAPEHHHHH